MLQGAKLSMYVNKCSKCGTEFETKNPKRVICPGCLYPDRNPLPLKTYSDSIPDNTQEKPANVDSNSPQSENQHQTNNRLQGRYPKHSF